MRTTPRQQAQQLTKTINAVRKGGVTQGEVKQVLAQAAREGVNPAELKALRAFAAKSDNSRNPVINQRLRNAINRGIDGFETANLRADLQHASTGGLTENEAKALITRAGAGGVTAGEFGVLRDLGKSHKHWSDFRGEVDGLEPVNVLTAPGLGIINNRFDPATSREQLLELLNPNADGQDGVWFRGAQRATVGGVTTVRVSTAEHPAPHLSSIATAAILNGAVNKGAAKLEVTDPQFAQFKEIITGHLSLLDKKVGQGGLVASSTGSGSTAQVRVASGSYGRDTAVNQTATVLVALKNVLALDDAKLDALGVERSAVQQKFDAIARGFKEDLETAYDRPAPLYGSATRPEDGSHMYQTLTQLQLLPGFEEEARVLKAWYPGLRAGLPGTPGVIPARSQSTERWPV